MLLHADRNLGPGDSRKARRLSRYRIASDLERIENVRAFSDVVVDSDKPVSSFVTVTFAPGTMAFDWSVTVPKIEPVSSCAQSLVAPRDTASANRINALRAIRTTGCDIKDLLRTDKNS